MFFRFVCVLVFNFMAFVYILFLFVYVWVYFKYVYSHHAPLRSNTTCSILQLTATFFLVFLFCKIYIINKFLWTLNYLFTSSFFVVGHIPSMIVMCFIMSLLFGSSILHNLIDVP